MKFIVQIVYNRLLHCLPNPLADLWPIAAAAAPTAFIACGGQLASGRQWPLGHFAVTLILALGSVLLGILLLYFLFCLCFWSVLASYENDLCL